MNQDQLLFHLFETIKQYTAKLSEPGLKVVDFKSPAELESIIPLNIEEEGVDESTLAQLMTNYLKYSVNTANRQFNNQLFSGLNLPAFVADVLVSLNNTSMYTYEVAPVATLIELELIRWMNGFTGFVDGDGTFLTGGSNANLIAMFSARNQLLSQTRLDGITGMARLKAFVSKDSHYSYDNAANLLGIGTSNLVKVGVDKHGRMIPEELDAAINECLQQGELPFFVGATCGTTVRAAFDPLDALAETCQKHNIWLHADGAFGGSLLLSNKFSHLFRGVEKADSFAWDAHKLMNIPLICSVLLFKKGNVLRSNLSDLNTSYIFHNNSEVEDLGTKSVQCGRRVDSVKLWFALKAFGLKGYARKMEHLMELAAYAEQKVTQYSKLELFVPRETLTVCFRYIPEKPTDTNQFNFQVRETLRKTGQSMVGIARIDGTLVIRLIVTNSDSQKSDIDTFFKNFINTATLLEKEI